MSRIQFWHSGEISADQSRRVLAQEQYMCSYLHQERFEDTKYVIRSNKWKKDRQYNGENEEDRTTTLHRKLKSEQCVLKILKPNKSLGEDGIISEFYITHWEQIKDEFFLLVNDTFEEKELTPSQYKGVLTLLNKSGEREDIRNWRPLTLLNSDYKIIAKILAERLKVVLPKLIHSDHKGFVKGRNISEANHLIQDVIEYTYREDDDGIIIFLDQQKAFDRVEW
jgi:hypothetical protein